MKYFIDTEFLEGTQKKTFPINLVRKETKPTIDLISIGIVAEDGREYYAISKDFNLREAWNRHDKKVNMNYKPSFGGGSDGHYNPHFIKEYWIRDNVLKPIYIELLAKEGNGAPMATSKEVHRRWNEVFAEKLAETHFTYKNLKRLINKYGKTNKQIAEEVKDFIYRKEPTIIKENLDKGYEQAKIDCNGKPEFYGYYCDYDWVVFCWLFGKMIDLPNGFPMYCIDLKQILDELQELENSNYEHELHCNGFTTTPLKVIKKLHNYPKQTNKHSAIHDARWNKQLYEFLNKI